MQFFETSAKTNYNVNETFTYLTREILTSSEGGINNKEDKGKGRTIDINEKPSDGDKKKKECCK